MITLITQVYVDGLKAKQIFEFLLNATDRDYQAWWPGVHLRHTTLKHCPNYVGNVIFIDQYIGDYRVKETDLIVEAIADRKILRQVVNGVRLPVRVVMEFDDDPSGVTITHTIEAGFAGLGRVLDPLFRLYFSPRFAAAMDEHVRAEFPRLRDLLHSASETSA
ncbi:MAG: hypothetical protein K8U03_22290 [Planctomycetia bacterium]|nr:hypothetical protein [Planctomycetia bacterium]